MKFFLSILVLGLSFVSCSSKNAQDRSKKNEADIQSAINNQRYAFLATSVMTSSGRTFQLSSRYSMEVGRDTVSAYLPYFGVAYSAPMDPSKGGINFTSTNFEYNKTNNSKGGWTISIKLKDADEVQQMFLNLTSDGYGTLQITSRNRQPISFSGHIEKAR